MQQKRWLDQQIEEKNRKNDVAKGSNTMYDTMQSDINTKWGQLDDDHQGRRKDMRVACRETLDQQIREKLERDALDKLLSDQQSQMHRDTVLGSDFYNERTNTCKSTVSDTRVLKYHWKGMDDTQRTGVLMQQERMRADNQSSRDLEKEQDRLYAEQQEKIRRDLIKMQRQHANEREQVRLDTLEFNRLKAKEDAERAKIMYDGVHRYK